VTTREVGAAWERQAESYQLAQGLRTLRRNINCRVGEIDLVMQDGKVTVFVEVRYRGGNSRVSAAQSVSHQKQVRLARAASLFLQRHPRLASGACRFDVVACEPGQAVDWIRNAFESPLV
jgi:putative endonuclease